MISVSKFDIPLPFYFRLNLRLVDLIQSSEEKLKKRSDEWQQRSLRAVCSTSVVVRDDEIQHALSLTSRLPGFFEKDYSIGVLSTSSNDSKYVVD